MSGYGRGRRHEKQVYFFLTKSSKKTVATLPLGKTSVCPCLGNGVRESHGAGRSICAFLPFGVISARTFSVSQTGRRFFRRPLVPRLAKPRSGFGRFGVDGKHIVHRGNCFLETP